MSVAINLVRFLCLQVTLKTCLAGIDIMLPKLEDVYGLIEPTVMMLTSCHESPENGIGVLGDSSDILTSSLKSKEYIPVIVIDDTRRRVDTAPLTSSQRHKLQLFLVMASSSSELREHLAGVKKSRWWNHMADIWLVKWPARVNDCRNAYAFLWTAWRMNILEAKFICFHGKRGKLIYGFNPYTRYAPHPWRLENVYNGENGHPWSLLFRKLASAPEPCRNISFDKAANLGGYEIRITMQETAFLRLLPNKTGIDALKCLTCSDFRAIFRSLNATAKLLVHEAEEPMEFLATVGNVSGLLADTHHGISDIVLGQSIEIPNLHRLDPFLFSGISIMTQNRGSASQIAKIASLTDVKSRVGLLIVCLLTFIFFKLFLRQTSCIASLNVLRMICNSCLPKLPSGTSSRIYLGSIFFFVVTFQGIYQGALSSLLAKRIPLPNIENMEDLRKSDHVIYAHHRYGASFSDPEFQGRFVGLKGYNCTEYVLRDTSNACVRGHNALVSDAAWFNLHLSKDFIFEYAWSLAVRQDWPLERKFNQKFQALFEADAFRRSHNQGVEDKLRKIKAKEDENTNKSFKILNVPDLTFVFVILGIGLTMAAVTFVLEVIRGRAYSDTSMLSKR